MLDRATTHGPPTNGQTTDSLHAQQLLEFVSGDRLGVMLYGSVARGDNGPSSDVDLLQLVEDRTEHYQVGKISVAVYTAEDLSRMCTFGSLFALHLVAEGRILEDPDGWLRTILESYVPPASYASMWREIAATSAALDVSPVQFSVNPIGVNRLGLYLLRCAAIIRHMELVGEPKFAIAELAKGLDLPELAAAFDGREDETRLDAQRLALVQRLLANVLGRPIRNPYGTLEALAVNLDAQHSIAARLILRLLAGERTLGYGDLLLDPVLAPSV